MVFNYKDIQSMVRLSGLLKLDRYCFQMVIEQCVHNARALLSALVQRLKDQYHLQSWYTELANSSKLCLYKKGKQKSPGRATRRRLQIIL